MSAVSVPAPPVARPARRVGWVRPEHAGIEPTLRMLDGLILHLEPPSGGSR